MKVIQHTAVRLTIQEHLFGITILGAVTGCTGIFMFFLFEPPVDWLGAFCIALGSIFTTLAPTETLTFDKIQKSLIIHQRHLLSHKVAKYSIADVKTVEINSVEMLGTRFYRVNLKMVSGKRLALTRTISTDWQQQQKIVRHIRGFLNPPIHYADAIEKLLSTKLSP
jgi:hypothetical protein